MSKIVVKDLVKIFGDHPEKALKMLQEGYSKEEILKKTRQTVGIYNINFSVNEGEVFVLMGLSGSGKSTLLRCINRLIEPTSGTITIDGEDITRAGPEVIREIRRKKVSMVFQRFALFPHRTVLDNVAYGLEVHGVPTVQRREKAAQIIETVGLKGWEYSMPDQLSGGMQQRVGLARALCNNPDILLMDEAFSALDPLIRKSMQDELISLQNSLNKTIVFVTHDLDEALKIGDRIALMNNGTIVQIGTAEEILTRPANDYVEKFVEDVDRTKVLTAEGVMKPPDPVIFLKDGPHVALRQMKEHGISSIFVVTRDLRLVGIVLAEDALRAVKEQREDLKDIIIEGVPKVSIDTPVIDIIPVLAETRLPVAVTRDDNKLVGILVKGSVLAGMVRKGENIA
ncbi:MAG TPA: glycine betaine/L-proline ABC transporter ATP-binding protein [Bacillota bacterium]|jgi:glycine betaine/proline transport system ATP-binding protein|nr:glycine betaine/L-proline ABC transporter ATP-binding protein [Peptococcaceae bacterium MAG4]NLW37750.1 glycine betaine/L-proline ABC transporter ATP-binding protein [Peptococcaceae bacterium]HPZ44036.1 glycine betaine/L-proline ABC transporter ATP-binding protein [Bacillota bacterium]HUM59267.1 glycine betaine/L-proline ABC transporter ATP-binding protein [Bacillota bacterium]